MESDSTTIMQLSGAISNFLAYKEINCNPSPKTLKNYRHYLGNFYKWAGDRTVNSLTMEDIENFLFFLHAQIRPNGVKRLGPQSMNHHRVALRILFTYCISHGVKAPLPDGIRSAKVPEKRREFLTREEVFKLIAAVQGRGIRALRNKALIGILFSTGLRVSELSSLNRSDIDLVRKEFAVIGKGSKVRLVFLDDFAVSAIANYFAHRVDTFPSLFINYKAYRINKDNPKKRRMHPESIRRTIVSITKKAGIQKHVTPHVLRHSFCTELLVNGVDILSAQEMMGHASPNTTMIYFHSTNSRLRESHSKVFNSESNPTSLSP